MNHLNLLNAYFQLIRRNLCQPREGALAHFHFRTVEKDGVVRLYLKPYLWFISTTEIGGFGSIYGLCDLPSDGKAISGAH